MDKLNRSKLKDAKKLYQSGNYHASHELIQEILISDPKNYNAIVLDGACCDRLDMEEVGMDLFHLATQIQPDNSMAWQGLLQLGRKNMDRYYETLVCTCLKLLHFYSDQHDFEKRIQCARTLIELLIRYRLELPEGVANLRSLCHMVLKSTPSDSFTLEMMIFLKIEAFFMIGLPSLINPSIHNSPGDDARLVAVLDDILGEETRNQLDSLAAECKVKTEWHSQTIEYTVQLGRLVQFAARLVDRRTDHSSPGWNDILNEVASVKFHGFTGFNTWFQRGCLPLHMLCLYALASFKAYMFVQCEDLLRHISSYCLEHDSVAQTESHRLIRLTSTPLSQCRSFLTTRPICTPFRSSPDMLKISGGDDVQVSVSPYHLLGVWALCLRLANASASELSECASQLWTCQAQSLYIQLQTSSTWLSVLRTLWVECCLTFNRLDLVLKMICPSDLDTLSLDKVAHVALTSDGAEIRFRLCAIQAAVEFVIHSSGPNEHTQATLERLSTMAMDLTHRLKLLRSARDHFLLARLLGRFTLASTAPQDAFGTMQLEQSLAGIEADGAYYANYLLVGQRLRATGYIKEALSALCRAHKLMPNSPETAYELAITFCQDNELVKALDTYTAVDKRLFTKRMWLNFGLIALRLNLPSQCVPALGNVVIADPNNALYWEILGEAYLLRRSYETAVKTFKRAIQLDPSRPVAHILCGLAYRNLGEFHLTKTHLISGLSRARESFKWNSANWNLLVFALKGVIEFSLLMEGSYLHEGTSVRAVNEFEVALSYLDEVFHVCSNTPQTPIWVYHYTAIAFSHLSVIDEFHLRCKLPDRFHSWVQKLAHFNSASGDDPGISLNAGLVLASIYFAAALKLLDSLTSCSKSRIEFGKAESPLILRCCLLVSFGLHCVSHSLYLRRNIHNTVIQPPLVDASRLLQFAESTLKRAVDLLVNDAARDQQYLDQHETDEDICEMNKIAQIESSDEQVVRNRLLINKYLRSKAWYGLAVLYSTMCADYEEHMTYCLCQSLLTNPKNTSAGISLALRLWHQGRTQFATSLLSHFQGSDPNDSLVWLASSHVHAITDAPETRPSQPDYLSYINHASLRDLLHAACLRTNIDVCLHLVNRLFPVLVEAVGWLNDLESRELLCTVESQKIVSFLRLAIEVTTESINRCLAYQPRNPVLWHNRGILLQLAGLSAPAAYCLKKTVKLLSGSPDVIEESRSHLQLAIAQCFLLSFICGSPDWEKADQLVFSSGDFNPTSCASLAEAFAKGLIYLHHPTKTIQLDLAAICLIDEPSRLVRQAVPQALVASNAWPDFGQWILRLFSAESDQMLIEIPGRFLTHSPVLPNHHYLLRTLCNISVTQGKALGPCNLYTVSRRRQIFYEQNTLCFDHGFTGHLLCENGCLRPEEHIVWILDNASLCASLSGSLCYGLAWLSRFVIYRPSDPNRWTAVAAWILTHHVISPPAADSFLLKEKNRSKSFPHFWRSFIQAVSTVLRLRLEAPISPLFANIVSECARHWIFIGPPPNLPESAISVMLFSLRRSAAMYPHTPDLLTHLKLFSSLYLPSV